MQKEAKIKIRSKGKTCKLSVSGSIRSITKFDSVKYSLIRLGKSEQFIKHSDLVKILKLLK